MRSGRLSTLLCALAIIAGSSYSTAHAQNTTYYRVWYNSNHIDGLPPLAVGPVASNGSLGSTGSVSAALRKGQFRAFATCSAPAAGANTPQIESTSGDEILAGDVELVSDAPLTTPLNVPLVMHMLLSGSLSSSGENPFSASVEVRVYGGGSIGVDDDGKLELALGGLTGTGVLAGAPATMVDQPVDFPVTLTAWPGFFNSLDISLNTRAGGTTSGSTSSTALADFMAAGLRFPTLTPVFETPPGIHVNIPSLGIVDNYWVDTASGVAAQPASGGLAIAMRQNPAAGAAEFAFTMARDGTARVEVFDVRGRRVATLLDGWQAAGDHALSWAGARNVPAGVYLAHASSGGKVATTRFTVVR